MPVFTLDLKGSTAALEEFPTGPVEGTVKSAELDVSKKGNPMLVITYRIYHPKVGEGEIKDYIVNSPAMANKNTRLIMALTGKERHEVLDKPLIDIDPSNLVGEQLILNLGHEEREGRVRVVVSPPWYWHASRTEVLPYLEKTPF